MGAEEENAAGEQFSALGAGQVGRRRNAAEKNEKIEESLQALSVFFAGHGEEPTFNGIILFDQQRAMLV